MNLTSIHEDTDLIPGLAQCLKDLVLRELWCRSQTRLRSSTVVAVALAGSCSSSLTPSLGTSICHRCGPKKRGKKRVWMKVVCRFPWCDRIVVYKGLGMPKSLGRWHDWLWFSSASNLDRRWQSPQSITGRAWPYFKAVWPSQNPQPFRHPIHSSALNRALVLYLTYPVGEKAC